MQNPPKSGPGSDPLAAALAAILSPVVRDAVAAALAERDEPKAPQLLTREEAAELLRVSVRQFDLLRRSDDPPPQRHVGDSPRFLADELLEWTRRSR